MGGRGDRLRGRLPGRDLGRSLALILLALGLAAAPLPAAQEAERDWLGELRGYHTELGGEDAQRGAALVGVESFLLELEQARGADGGPSPSGVVPLVQQLQITASVHATTLPPELLDELFATARDLVQGSPGHALNIALSQSRVQRRVGRDEEARRTLEWAIEEYSDARDKLPDALLMQAEWCLHDGDWEKSFALLDRAEELLMTGPQFDVVRCRLIGTRVEAYLLLGLLDLARTALDEQSALAAELWAQFPSLVAENPAMEVMRGRIEHLALDAARRRAEYGLASEHPASVVRELEVALEDPERFATLKGGRANLLVLLAPLLAECSWSDRDGNWAERARSAFDAASEDPYVVPAEKVAAELFLADLAVREGDVATAREILDRARAFWEGGDRSSSGSTMHVAFAASLEHRIARLFEGAADEDLRAAQAVAFDALLDSWERVPYREGGVGFLNLQFRRLVVAERIAACLDGGGERAAEEAFAVLLRAERYGTLARALGTPATDLEQVRSVLLGAEAGALVYFGSRYGSYLFALDAESLECFELPADEQLRAAARELSRYVTQPPYGLPEAERRQRADDLQRCARAASDLLIPAPLRERVAGWRELTLVGTEFAGRPLFACLPLDADGATSLGETHAIAHLPALAVGVALERRPQRPASLDAAFVLAPTFAPKLVERFPSVTPLSLPESMSARLTQPFGADAVRVVDGERATWSELVRLGAEARVLQIVTHGVVDLDRERGACLVVAPGADHTGLVTPEEIQAMGAPPVVVLTACRTGTGPIRLGDAGIGDLSGAFLQAGARAVLLSAYPMGLEGSLALGERLNVHLRSGGLSPAEALRRARVDLVREGRWRDPFDLALFEVVGLGHRAPFAGVHDADYSWPPNRSRSRLLVASGAVALALVAMLQLRRRESARRPSES